MSSDSLKQLLQDPTWDLDPQLRETLEALAHQLQGAQVSPHMDSLIPKLFERYRHRITYLEQQLSQLTRNATHNEQVFRSYQQVQLALMGAQSPAEIPPLLQTHLAQAPIDSVKVWGQPDRISWAQTCSLPAWHQLQQRLAQSDGVYFGRLNLEECQGLGLSDPAQISVVLLSVQWQQFEVILGAVSDDPAHFVSGLDPLLLKSLGQMLGKWLEMHDGHTS